MKYPPLPAVCTALLVTVAVLGAKTSNSVTLPGLQHDGSVLLPNQWSLRPVVKQIPVGDFPVNVATHPQGRFSAVLHSGYGRHEIRILDLKTEQQVSEVELEDSFYGLAWSLDGHQLYASGGSAEVIYAF